jgi:hypothetical protein
MGNLPYDVYVAIEGSTTKVSVTSMMAQKKQYLNDEGR